jgi:hypothetical protein
MYLVMTFSIGKGWDIAGRFFNKPAAVRWITEQVYNGYSYDDVMVVKRVMAKDEVEKL